MTMLNYDLPNLIPINPLRIQGHTIRLDLGSSNWPFVRLDGTTELTAGWDAGPFEIRAALFESDQVSGIPPFTVASTTVVPNLNVDAVDGKHVGTSGNVIPLLDAANTWTGIQTFGTNNKLKFRDNAQFIQSIGAGFLTIEAGVLFTFNINNNAEAVITAAGFGVTNRLTAADGAFIITTGSPPLIITSTTVVANLNVDQVDGKEAAELNPTTTKGDLVGYDTGEARIPVGTNDHVLTADSTQSLGVKWAAAGGGGGSSLTVSTTQVFSGSSPTTMTNLDLSGTVGSNVAVVALSFKSSLDMNALAVRKDGDANEYYSLTGDANASGVHLGHHDGDFDLVLIVSTSSSGIIEWTTETTRTCTVDILWYIA